ncbi:oligoendopeptidase F [Candidatus Woesearchaeota archaeon]|nr:MAG: oligoendopeptidase F [Candidatus Woesearchaeota archaeon]
MLWINLISDLSSHQAMKWNLDHLFEGKECSELIDEVKSRVEDFEKHRENLSNLSVEDFLRVLREYEQISEILSRLEGFAGLRLSENTSSPEANAQQSAISELSAEVSNRTMFFSLWFKGLPDDKAEKYISGSGKYRYFLERLRAYRPYTLKEREEQIISLKDLSGVEACTRIYDSVTNRFEFEYKGKKMTQEEINQFKTSKDRSERKASYDLVLSRYGENQYVLGEVYKSIVNDWRNENVKIRGFESPISVRNKANDIPDKAIEALLSVVRENIGLFREYFKLKANLLNIENIDRYDLYMRYEDVEKEYSFEDSKRLVLETYRDFDDRAYRLAKEIFDKGHVHAFPEKGKRSGAFCWTVTKDIAPYVLLNHVGKLKDAFTMAHELGHGIHGSCVKDQTHFTFHAPLPLAETASIFGEMLLSKKLLSKASDEEKIAILVHDLDGQYASIARQAYFVLFEIAAHSEIEKGASWERLNELYLENLKEQFAEVMPVPEVFKYEWSYIPHIHHTPFYCYAYAFGNLLVLALYKMYEEQGKAFVDKYFKILSYGGSKAPAKILSEVGIDITDKSFWRQGFEIIRREVDELRRLIEKMS